MGILHKNFCYADLLILCIAFLKTIRKVMMDAVMEMVSDTGSARNTANTLLSKKCGSIKISGISRIIFLKSAMNNDTFACPSEMNDVWHAHWIPKMDIPRKYTGITLHVSSRSSLLSVNSPVYICGAKIATPASSSVPVRQTRIILFIVAFTRSLFPAP